MQRWNGSTLFSASDLVNFMGCTHATFLDLRNLSPPVAFPPDDEQVALLQEKGLAQERDYLAHLKAEGRTVVEIAGDASVEETDERTRDPCSTEGRGGGEEGGSMGEIGWS